MQGVPPAEVSPVVLKTNSYLSSIGMRIENWSTLQPCCTQTSVRESHVAYVKLLASVGAAHKWAVVRRSSLPISNLNHAFAKKN